MLKQNGRWVRETVFLLLSLLLLLLLLLFSYFVSRKEQSRAGNFMKKTGILLRVGAVLFLFWIFSDKK